MGRDTLEPQFMSRGDIKFTSHDYLQFFRVNVKAGKSITAGSKSNTLYVGNGISTPEFTADQQLTLLGNTVFIQQAKLMGNKGITVDTTKGNLVVGTGSLVPHLKTEGDIVLTSVQHTDLTNGLFEAKGLIKATTTTHKLTVGSISGAAPHFNLYSYRSRYRSPNG